MRKNSKKLWGVLPVYAVADLHTLTTGPNTETGKVMQVFGAKTYENSQSIVIFIGNIIVVVLGMLGVLMVGLIIYSGFLWMTASGDSEQIKSAQGHLKNAVIGAIIVVSAWTITTFVISMLGNAATVQ